MPKTTQLKRVSMERGKEALTPNNSGWFGSTLNALGITSAPLSLQTCLHSFCTSEELIKKEKYKCEKCKEKKRCHQNIKYITTTRSFMCSY